MSLTDADGASVVCRVPWLACVLPVCVRFLLRVSASFVRFARVSFLSRLSVSRVCPSCPRLTALFEKGKGCCC